MLNFCFTLEGVKKLYIIKKISQDEALNLFNIVIFFNFSCCIVGNNIILHKKNFYSKMYSSDEDEYKNENFSSFLSAKKNIYEWKELEYEYEIPCVFHDTLLDLKKEKKFDLWENKFNIEKNVHLTSDHLDFHYVYNEKCIPFLLKIENICMAVRKGRHLLRITYLELFATGQTELLCQIHPSVVTKLYEMTRSYEMSLDLALIRIEGVGQLPLNKIT